MPTTIPVFASPLDPAALIAFHRSVFGDARMEADTEDTSGDDVDTSGGDDAERDVKDTGSGQDRDGLGEGGKRALEAERRERRAAEKAARENEARAKELAEQIAEYERAQLTDQERIAAERDDWRKKFEEQAAQLAARDLDVLRRDVAAEKGLPAGMARRLNGTTREELEADAEELTALVVKTDQAQVPRAPKPDPSQGVMGNGSRASTVTAAMERYMADRGAKPTT